MFIRDPNIAMLEDEVWLSPPHIGPLPPVTHLPDFMLDGEAKMNASLQNVDDSDPDSETSDDDDYSILIERAMQTSPFRSHSDSESSDNDDDSIMIERAMQTSPYEEKSSEPVPALAAESVKEFTVLLSELRKVFSCRLAESDARNRIKKNPWLLAELKAVDPQIALTLFTVAIRSQREMNVIFVMDIPEFVAALTKGFVELCKDQIKLKPICMNIISNHSSRGIEFMLKFAEVQSLLMGFRRAEQAKLQTLVYRKSQSMRSVQALEKFLLNKENGRRLGLFDKPVADKKLKLIPPAEKLKKTRMNGK